MAFYALIHHSSSAGYSLQQLNSKYYGSWCSNTKDAINFCLCDPLIPIGIITLANILSIGSNYKVISILEIINDKLINEYSVAEYLKLYPEYFI